MAVNTFKRLLLPGTVVAALLAVSLRQTPHQPSSVATAFVSYTADLRYTALKFYWKDSQNRRFSSLGKLANDLATRGQRLLFAMNGGMFNPSFSPQGLFIENGNLLTPLDTTVGAGNFYLKPNGIFYTTRTNTAHICRTADFRHDSSVAYATQSGPMLVIDGRIHPAFQPGSVNRQIRNGVGILPDNRVLFAMSTAKISFYDFASYFQKAGCRNALYLDGFVSRTYAPATGWMQTDGDFGVIIGITAPQQPRRPPSPPVN